jgi:hypothetical protein
VERGDPSDDFRRGFFRPIIPPHFAPVHSDFFPAHRRERERVLVSNNWHFSFRNLEYKAQAASAEDPESTRQEIIQKRETANIKAPSDSMIKRLAAHRIFYQGKTYTNDGSRTWIL